MKFTKFSDLPQKTWKNGQGITTEIAIEPSNASFQDETFLWRISCAEIKSRNIFSQFKGYDRALLVWKGDGILLNGKKLDPFTPHKFSGEDSISCDLVNSEVLDIGVIFKRGQADCRLSVIPGKANGTDAINVKENETCFIFCAVGAVDAGECQLTTGDILKVKGPMDLTLTFISSCRCIVIDLSLVR